MVKYLIIYIASFLLILSCQGIRKPAQNISLAEKPVRIANDSLEYEVIIFDQGFTTYLNTIALPKGYYGQSFLENNNQRMVTTYNIRANQPIIYGNLYPQKIDYNFNIDYGYEVNYLIYNYLLFFEQKYQQSL